MFEIRIFILEAHISQGVRGSGFWYSNGVGIPYLNVSESASQSHDLHDYLCYSLLLHKP